MTSLYYECHVTIEPVFEERLEELRKIAQCSYFHVAELLMQKREEDTPERSKYDTFCTGRSKSYYDMVDRMRVVVFALQDAGFKVWRYKIEDAVLDSRYGDTYSLLHKDDLPDKELYPRPMVDDLED